MNAMRALLIAATLLRGHTSTITGLAFVQNGRVLVSSSLDGTVRFWDVDAAKPIATLHQGAEVYAVAAIGERYVLSTGADQRVILWSTATHVLGRAAKLPARCLAAVALGKDRVVVGCSDSKIRILRVPDLTVEREISAPNEVFALAVSPDGKRIASSLPIKIWDAQTGALVVGDVRGWGQGGLAYSPDGKWLADGEWTGGVRFFAAETGAAVARAASETKNRVYGPNGFTELRANMPIAAVVFTPDSKQLIAGGGRRAVEVYAAGVEGDTLRTLGAHEASVTALAVRADGLVASGSADHTIRLWRTR